MAKDLKVSVIGDASSYSRALNKASGETEGFGHSLLKLGKYAALGLGAAGVGGALITLKRGFDELKESQQVAAQTGAVLKSTGNAANTSAQQVEGLATSLSRMSGADDEAVQAGENMLLTFTNIRNQTGKNNDIFNQATKTLTDFSFAMNRGAAPSAEQLSKNAILLGKALNDPIKGVTALRRVGVAFTEDQIKTIKSLVDSGHAMDAQKLILRELNKEFSGSAAAAGKTLPGQLNKLKNAFDEVAGALAAKLLPVLTKLVEWVNSHWTDIAKVFDQVGDAVIKAVTFMADQIRTHWTSITGVVRGTVDQIISTGERLIEFFQTDIGKSVAIAAASMGAFAEASALTAKAITLIGKATTAVGGAPQLIAITALLTGITYLGIKLGAIHNPFAAASADAKAMQAAFDSAAASARNAADAIASLQQKTLDVDVAQARVTSTLHNAQAAQQTYNEFVNKGTQSTLAGKQAHDQAISSWQQHKQAVLDLTKATQEHDKAQQAANATIVKAVPGLAAMQSQLDKLATLSGGDAAKAAENLGNKLFFAGQEAVASAEKLAKTNPAAASAARAMGILQEAAGNLVLELGRVPTNKEIIARAKLLGGPEFEAGLKRFVSGARDAGVQIPAWLAQAVGPTRAQAAAIGAAAAQGVASGIRAYMPAAIAQGLAMIDQLMATMRTAAGAHSPAKKTIELGKDMVDGLAIGLKYLGPTLAKALMDSFEGSIKSVRTVATRGLNSVGQLIVNAAKKYGVDAKAALAVAMGEGGIKFGAVGDSGHAFGPFQFNNAGGVATGKSAAEASAWANSAKGVADAIRMMAEAGAKGKVGLDAITTIIRNFERPLDPSASIAKAAAAYKTLGPQIASSISTGSATVQKTLTSQLQGLIALVKQYAPQIGIEHVRGIIAGLVGKTPDIVAAAKAQMEKIVAAMALVSQTRTDLKDAFRSMAQGALAAFDEVASKWTPPSLRKLNEMQREDTINSAVKQVSDAQAAVDAAVAAQANLTRTEGESDADFAARVEEAKRNVQTAVEAVGAAQRSYEETQLQLRAEQEQKAHDIQMASDREHLAAQLAQLGEFLDQHPEKYAETQRKIIKLLKKYHVPMFEAGQAIAQRFADGLDDGIAAVAATARKLAAALDDVVKATGGGGGGGANVNPGTAIGGGHGAGVPTGAIAGRASAGSVNVNVYGDVLSEDQLLTKVRTGLNRYATNNAINPLTA